MPYETPGKRHTAKAVRDCVHGQIVFVDNMVGTAFKSEQIDRWTRPEDADKIAEDEDFELQIGGNHEAPATDDLASADIGDLVYIDPDDDSLTTTSATGLIPVGVVSEVVANRFGSDEGVRINSNALNAFLAVPAPSGGGGGG